MKRVLFAIFLLVLPAATVLAQDYNTPLQNELLQILETDQQYRIQIDSVRKTFGNNSSQMKGLLQTMHRQDSVNLVKVKAIVAQHGWMGPDEIGLKPYSALFLVIQHADQQIQEEFLPMIRVAAKRGDARPSDLALLEDRVALKQGKKQLYGSQMGTDANGEMYVLPLEDPDNVDKRRQSVGLPPMAEYVKHFGATWDVEAYKKQQAKK